MKRVLSLLFALLLVGVSAAAVAAQSRYPCRNWLTLTQTQKTALIAALVKRAGEDKIDIRLKPGYYVEVLDRLIEGYADAENEQALDTSLGLTIHTLAAMEGDWDNGEDPVEHARKLMGEEMFEAFRKRHSEKYEKLLEKSRKKKSKE